MEGGLFLYVVVRQRSAVLELLASKDETLLVWRDAFLVLNLRLHIIDGIRRLDLKGDRLPGECLDDYKRGELLTYQVGSK